MEYLTFIAKADFPQDDDYKSFTSKIEYMARVLQDKLIKIEK